MMKHTRKIPLRRTCTPKDIRRILPENDLIRMAADREGRALLESYCRMYRSWADGQIRD